MWEWEVGSLISITVASQAGGRGRGHGSGMAGVVVFRLRVRLLLPRSATYFVRIALRKGRRGEGRGRCLLHSKLHSVSACCSGNTRRSNDFEVLSSALHLYPCWIPHLKSQTSSPNGVISYESPFLTAKFMRQNPSHA